VHRIRLRSTCKVSLAITGGSLKIRPTYLRKRLNHHRQRRCCHSHEAAWAAGNRYRNHLPHRVPARQDRSMNRNRLSGQDPSSAVTISVRESASAAGTVRRRTSRACARLPERDRSIGRRQPFARVASRNAATSCIPDFLSKSRARNQYVFVLPIGIRDSEIGRIAGCRSADASGDYRPPIG